MENRSSGPNTSRQRSLVLSKPHFPKRPRAPSGPRPFLLGRGALEALPLMAWPVSCVPPCLHSALLGTRLCSAVPPSSEWSPFSLAVSTGRGDLATAGVGPLSRGVGSFSSQSPFFLFSAPLWRHLLLHQLPHCLDAWEPQIFLFI